MHDVLEVIARRPAITEQARKSVVPRPQVMLIPCGFHAWITFAHHVSAFHVDHVYRQCNVPHVMQCISVQQKRRHSWCNFTSFPDGNLAPQLCDARCGWCQSHWSLDPLSYEHMIRECGATAVQTACGLPTYNTNDWQIFAVCSCNGIDDRQPAHLQHDS